MLHDFTTQPAMTAVEIRGHLAKLEAERALALTTGLAEVNTYMSELHEEIEVCRQLYVVSSVTEIATLRAELFGAQLG
jgi:hypothetical protein